MFKSKYVVCACLAWFSHCPPGAAHATKKTIPTSPVVSNLQVDAPPEDDSSGKAKITPEDAEVDECSTTRGLVSEQGTAQAASFLETSNTPLPGQSKDPDSAPALPDSAQDTEPPEPEHFIHSTIQYDAKDAIFFDVKSETIRLCGEGVIKHGTIKLEAEDIFLDLNHYTITALGKKNKAGELEKKAVLTKDNLEYLVESICYNFESQRAIANKLFTKSGDIILRANKVKKNGDNIFYADRAIYTTCNLPKPHFHVEARRVKIIEGEKVVSGPFKLYFDGVPTPLGFIFGIFYLPREGSGIIPPKYGGESVRGFCLKNFGYYMKFDDYADLALQGSIYSKGSTKFTAKSRYKKRYQYSGDLYYERRVDLSTRETEYLGEARAWELKWNHNTENNKTGSLNAEVHLRRRSSPKMDFLRNGDSPGSISSNVRYTNKLVGLPYTLGISLQHTYNLQTKIEEATIPKTTLRTGAIYLFRKKGDAAKHWYSAIHFQHNIEFSNKLRNKLGDEVLDLLEIKNWPRLWENSKRGVQQTIPLQADVKILRHFNLTPKLEWQERWYWEKKNYKYDPESDSITKEKVPGFVRTYDYSLGAALKTTLYGTHFWRGNTTLRAFRHELEPIVSFIYTPDLSDPSYGYWQTVEEGKRNGEKLNRFEGAIYGAPSDRARAVLKIELNNRLDAKIRTNNEPDRSKKIPILESFDWSTSYDFRKDQHRWGDVQFKTRTSLVDKLVNVGVDFESTFNPYLYEDTGLLDTNNRRKYSKSDKLAWNHGKGLGHMKSASLSIDAKLATRINPNKRTLAENSRGYFEMPWNLGLKYNWGYTCDTPGDDPKKTNSLGVELRMSLTEKWQVTCKSAYDFTHHRLAEHSTSIGIHRDLHCWEMDFHWNPLGETQAYKFSIGLKAPLLKDLKYSRQYP